MRRRRYRVSAWEFALLLADGDAGRLERQPDGSVLVLNQSRRGADGRFVAACPCRGRRVRNSCFTWLGECPDCGGTAEFSSTDGGITETRRCVSDCAERDV